MQNSVLSAAEGTSWKDHHANIDRPINHYSLHRNNAMNSISHNLVSDKTNDAVRIVIKERLLFRSVFLQKRRWRIGYPNLYLRSPRTLGRPRSFIRHYATMQ